MRSSSKLAVISCATLAITCGFSWAANADPVLFNGTYSSSEDSPFNSSNFSYFFLEDFEDGLLNIPGVTASGGHAIGLDEYGDSVEGGSSGHSWYSSLTEPSFTFTFDAAALGGLPRHAGLVWTDIGRIGTNNRNSEVDHLQYGAAAVPEPSTILMVGIGAATMLRNRLKRRKQIS